jgi:triacylglycerol lipase
LLANMAREFALFLLLLVGVVVVVALYGRRAYDRRRALEDIRRDSASDGVAPAPDPAERPALDARAAIAGLDFTRITLGRPAPTRHPIVLSHGYFGFDAIGASRLKREYFHGVRERLEALGYSVHLIRVSRMAGVEQRARQLAEQIRQLPGERVNIIAHSMGGLDARYAIAQLGLDARVASLTTIGTPHRGTPIADSSASLLGDRARLRRLLASMGANVDGLYDLTTRRMADFNRLVLDAPSVRYASVVGAVAPSEKPSTFFLAPGHAYLLRTVGPNDGMVPAESQRWGTVLGEIAADHWAQIGWSRGFDARALYALLVEHLSTLGL